MFRFVTIFRQGHPDILNSSPRDHLLTSAPPPSFHYQPSLLNLVELERHGGERAGEFPVRGRRLFTSRGGSMAGAGVVLQPLLI